MNERTASWSGWNGEWMDRLLELGLWLAAGYVMVYSSAHFLP